jgi:hypothetical protein
MYIGRVESIGHFELSIAARRTDSTTRAGMPEPIFVPGDRTTFNRLCDQCVAEKVGWEQGSDTCDVRVRGEVPIDQDEAWIECPRGHRHLVLREGSERVRNFL